MPLSIANMSQSTVFRTLLLLGCVGCSSCNLDESPVEASSEPPATVTAAVTGPPNIVVVMADDMRCEQLRHMPLTKQALGNHGVTFAKCLHTGTVCCNSRAVFLSGQAQHNNGVLDNYGPGGGAPAFNHATSIGVDMKAAGYRTALIGKYLNNTEAMGPLWVAPGWDEWRVFKEGGSGSSFNANYYNYTLTEKPFGSSTVADSAYGFAESQYSTRVLRRKALDFLKRAPLTTPVFLVITPYAPHTAVSVLSQDVGKCNGYAFAESPSSNEADVSDKPAFVQAKPVLTSTQIANSQAARKKQCEALQTVDRLVNDVIYNLQQSGRLANTLFVFTADNGYMWNEHRLKNRKHTVYQEGITTPLVIRGPGVAVGAVDSTSLVHIADLTATFRAIGGAAAGTLQHGVDLSPILATPNAPWTQELLIENLVVTPTNENFSALRTPQWVYVEYPAGGPGGAPFVELYDMLADPWQMVNQAGNPTYSGVRTALAARLTVRKVAP